MTFTGTTLPGAPAADLKQVAVFMREALQPVSVEVAEMLDHLFQVPGKMLRPMLVLTCARLFAPHEAPAEAARVAAAVELIHTASLVHDDIIDAASMRRGVETLHRRWGAKPAVMAGDLLLARAFKMLAELLSNSELLPLMSRAVSMMCYGEIAQLARSFDWRMTEQEYFHFNFLKTSHFLASCCEAGGRVSGAASSDELRALRRYGCKLGQAFQVVDDILDFTGKPQKLGKPVGCDLNQGVITLPVIYLLHTRKRYLNFIREIFERRSLTHSLQEELRTAVLKSGALEYAYRKAVLCKKAALEALQELPPSPSRDLLAYMAEAVTARASFLEASGRV